MGEDDAARKLRQSDVEPHIDDNTDEIVGHLEEQHE